MGMTLGWTWSKGNSIQGKDEEGQDTQVRGEEELENFQPALPPFPPWPRVQEAFLPRSALSAFQVLQARGNYLSTFYQRVESLS